MSQRGARVCAPLRVHQARSPVYNPIDMSPEQMQELRQRTESDPNDEIAHFSLSRALVESGDPAEGAKALQRVIALNPNIAKAYQLLGEAQIKTGHRDYAIQTLTEGVNVAHCRGDLMPEKEMSKMLADLGAPVPQFADPRAA